MWSVKLMNGEIVSENKCNWKMLPNVPIAELRYLLPNKKILHLQGFEQYIVMKEYYQFFMSKKEPQTITVNILGKFKEEVYQFSLHLGKQKAVQTKNQWGKEFASIKLNPITQQITFGKPQKTNHDLWHSGIPIDIPIAKLI